MHMDLHFFKGSLEAESSMIKKFAMSMNSGVIIFKTHFVEEVSRLLFSDALHFLTFRAACFIAHLEGALKKVAMIPELAVFDTVSLPRMKALFAGQCRVGSKPISDTSLLTKQIQIFNNV